MIEFFQRVQDQVIPTTPSGDASGAYQYAPRLEAWIPAAGLYGVPGELVREVIDGARLLHEYLSGRAKIGAAALLPPAELAPPDLEVADV